MDDMGIDPMLRQPPSQPKSVTPGFKSDCDALDSPPFPDRLIAPPVQNVQQCLSSGAIFFKGCRSSPGTLPAINQLDWLSSMTATRVVSFSKGTRDLLKSCAWGIRFSIGVDH